MNFIKQHLFILSAFVHFASLNAQTPAWVLADWKHQAAGSGTWLTDNSAYKSADEPFDQYGLQWSLGSGQTCLRGRLFGKTDGKEVASFWEFFLFWDPEKGQTRIIQIGGDGTVGEGWIWMAPDGIIKSEQRFTRPGGAHWDSGHEETAIGENERITQSFDIIEGLWTARRKYVWKRGN